MKIGKGTKGKSWRRFVCGVAVALLALICTGQGQSGANLTVSAAISLKDALTQVEAAYSASHRGVRFGNNLGGSGTLAMQIEQGAPVDVFLSAAEGPMNRLQAKGLLVNGTRRDLLRNTLVLIAPLDSPLTGFAGLTANSVRILALGDPASVPAGRYGKQTLASLHLLDRVQSKIVLTKDVRQVLAYVETGNADAGLVYATDARISNRVRVVATAPDAAHDPIVYPVAVIQGSREQAQAREFAAYLAGPEASAIFKKNGFSLALHAR